MFSSVPTPSSSLSDPSSSPMRVRLRPFSYLRTYRQNHSHSVNGHGSHRVSSHSEAHSPGGRPKSCLPQTSAANLLASEIHSPPPRSQPVEQTISKASSVQPNNQESSGATSGWLPTVGGQSGVSRIATEPQATATESSSAVLSNNNAFIELSEIPTAMTRTHTVTSRGVSDVPLEHGRTEHEDSSLSSGTNESPHPSMGHQLPSIRLSVHQDPHALRPSLVFSPMFRILPSGQEVLRVGRYSEKDVHPAQATNIPSSAPIGFKSKVVSRRHCEFWWSAGNWFVKDVKSSSGTFLNHIRLSAPGIESRPFPVNDGDILQLGIDFKGGEEMIFRCVKIRVELNKGWQTGPSSFNMQSHKRLRELSNLGKLTKTGPSQDCSICLGPIAPCQSLFVAPCSHTWHYKCIRVIINGPLWPHFICPNCRNVADLDAETDDPHADEWEEADVGINEVEVNKSLTPAKDSTETMETPTRSNIMRTNELDPPGRNNQSMVALAVALASNVLGENLSHDPDERRMDAAYRLDHHHVYEASSPVGHSSSDFSNVPVAPIEAIPRRLSNHNATPHPSSSAGSGAQQNTRAMSAKEIGSLEVTAGVEELMTPRNNVGPFVFDGCDADHSNGAITPMNLDAAADTRRELPARSHAN